MIVVNISHRAGYHVNPICEGDAVIMSMKQTGCFVLAARDAVKAGDFNPSACLLTIKTRSAHRGLQTWFDDREYIDFTSLLQVRLVLQLGGGCERSASMSKKT